MTGTRAGAQVRTAWPVHRLARWTGVAVFGVGGLLKLAGYTPLVIMFDAIGMGQALRYTVGVAELGGAILLILPRFVFLGSLGLAGVMLGAVFTDALVLHRPPVLSGLMLVLMMIVMWESGHSSS